MNKQCFEDSAWYHAMTLTERIASLPAKGDRNTNTKVDFDLAQQRMKRWRKQSPFMDNSYFNQRLDLDGITEDEFLYLLGEPIEAVKERLPIPPNWLTNLAQAFLASNITNFKPLSYPNEFKGKKIELFLDVIEPLIRQGREQVQAEVLKLNQIRSDLPFIAETIVDLLEINLSEQLLNICSRTMVLELQIAGLQGLLKGDSPQERFYSFLKQLRQDSGIVSLLKEYPILARQLTICIDQWIAFSIEFLQHFCADWDEIKATFSPEQDPGHLLEVQGSQGDTHRQGRSVVNVKFSSGLNLVYKPRSLATEVHFQQLLTWLNERGVNPLFRTLKNINRDSYGWVEFVTHQTCTSKEEVQRFYERQGGYLALLYVLEANDLHYGNLIAAGEHPVLVDLETLFQPRLAKIESQQAHMIARETLNHSVLRTGLLPRRIWFKGDDDGIDMSALGGKGGQMSSDKLPYWEGVGTDEMQLKRKQMKTSKRHNRPTLHDAEVNLLDHLSAIVSGFTKVYELLLKHRDELLSEDGILSTFAQDEVRVLLRSSQFYALLLWDNCHPKMMRNSLARERLFDRLWLPIEHQPHLAKIIPAEREDLWNGDIPLFTTQINSRDLFTSSGKQITDFFAESGMTMVKRCLMKLSQKDLAQQLHFIKASFAIMLMSPEQVQKTTYPLTEPKNMASRHQLLAAAQAIGDRLEELALHGRDDATWIGLKLSSKEQCLSLVSSGIDLYSGLPGMTLFLAYLGTITEQKRYTSLAQAALTTLKLRVEANKEFFKSIGGFSGWGGVIYTLNHLGMLWDEPSLVAEAQELVELLPPLIEEDKGLTFGLGSAGCIISLLGLYRCSPSKSTLNAAILCGDHLIAEAKKMTQGIGWVIPAQDRPLTGLVHGTAGIAWALLELSSMTGEQRFRTAALEAIIYERSLFNPDIGNWPDLRNLADTVLSEKDNHHQCMTAWCHGAPGIGLARLQCLPNLNDHEIKAEIDTAINTTLANGFGRNHSLCHGDLGNLELLLQASLTLGSSQWKTEVERLTAIILESIEQHGWLGGVLVGVETPGLMIGLAGIGYELLRLAEPDRVPSILVLEPPQNKFNQEQNTYRFSQSVSLATR